MASGETSPMSSEVGGALRGIIFDLDGTLCSTLPLIIHCFTKVYAKYLNRTMTAEEIIDTFGPTARDLINDYGTGFPTEVVGRAVSAYYDCYKRNSSERILVFPGIPELLGKLHQSGRRLAVVTGVERLLMDHTLGMFGLKTLFAVTVAGDDVQHHKPDPEGLRLALSNMQVSLRECIFIGDSPADIHAGKAAGILTGAALWSPEGKGDPTNAVPDYKFRSVRELSDFLLPHDKKGEPGFYFANDDGPR